MNRSFLGMGRGTMGDRTSSGFFLHRTWGSQPPAGRLGSLGPSPGLGWVPEAGGDQPRETLGFVLLRTAFISAFINGETEEEKGLVQGHKAEKWRSQNSNPGLIDSKTHALFWLPLKKQIPRYKGECRCSFEGYSVASVSPVIRSWRTDWRMGEPHSRELNDVVHKGDDGGSLCCRMLINEPTGAVFCHDELQRRMGTPTAPGPWSQSPLGSHG